MKRKAKKRSKVKAKKQEITETKFWIFLSLALALGFVGGVFLYGPISGTGFITDEITIRETFSNCIDSDGGFVIESRGICNYGTGNLIDKCVMKGQQRVLLEYSCVNNKCVPQEIYCEDHCEQPNPSYELCYLGSCHCE
jgi:hypothetical protein